MERHCVCACESRSRGQFLMDGDYQHAEGVAALSSHEVARLGELVASELETRTVKPFVAS